MFAVVIFQCSNDRLCAVIPSGAENTSDTLLKGWCHASGLGEEAAKSYYVRIVPLVTQEQILDSYKPAQVSNPKDVQTSMPPELAVIAPEAWKPGTRLMSNGKLYTLLAPVWRQYAWVLCDTGYQSPITHNVSDLTPIQDAQESAEPAQGGGEGQYGKPLPFDSR